MIVLWYHPLPNQYPFPSIEWAILLTHQQFECYRCGFGFAGSESTTLPDFISEAAPASVMRCTDPEARLMKLWGLKACKFQADIFGFMSCSCFFRFFLSCFFFQLKTRLLGVKF